LVSILNKNEKIFLFISLLAAYKDYQKIHIYFYLTETKKHAIYMLFVFVK